MGYTLIASSSNFANANNNGNANNNNASNVGGVRPLLRRYQNATSRMSEQGMSVYPSFLVNKCHDATAYGRCRSKRGISQNIMNITANQYLDAAKKLAKSSGWKYKSQAFLLNRLSEIAKLKKEIETGTYEPQEGSVFEINENGHRRLVKSMTPRDAVLQHALCDGVIIPKVKEHIIHDNGAGLKGRGLSFTRRRFEGHLRWHYRRYGTEGYALIIDFSKYFDNIRHEDAIRQLETIFRDEQLTNLAKKILKTYEVDISYTENDLMGEVFNSLEYVKIPKGRLTGDRMMRKSLGIGAPISQIIGILYPTLIDQYVKTVKGVHGYDAYMDDRIVLHPDKAFLRALLRDIEALAERLGIHINKKKTQIVKLSHGFTWLKTRYILTETGKIIKKIPKDVTKRERRKLKKLAQKVAAGDMTAKEYENQYRAWRGDKKRYNAYKTLKSMDFYKRRQSSWTKSKEKS